MLDQILSTSSVAPRKKAVQLQLGVPSMYRRRRRGDYGDSAHYRRRL